MGGNGGAHVFGGEVSIIRHVVARLLDPPWLDRPILERAQPVGIGLEATLDPALDRIHRSLEFVWLDWFGGQIGEDLAGGAEEGVRALRPKLGSGIEYPPVGKDLRIART